jgi:phosphoglycolate phosphatase
LPESRYSELADRYRFHYVMDEERLAFFDGIEPLLDSLVERGHTLAIATGKSRAGLDRALAQIGSKPWFSYSRTADETRSKPHPLMLEQLLAQTGAEAARTLMVADTTHDLQLALNAGTPSLAVAYGAHDSAALEALAPLACVKSVAELSGWLHANG